MAATALRRSRSRAASDAAEAIEIPRRFRRLRVGPVFGTLRWEVGVLHHPVWRLALGRSEQSSSLRLVLPHHLRIAQDSFALRSPERRVAEAVAEGGGVERNQIA